MTKEKYERVVAINRRITALKGTLGNVVRIRTDKSKKAQGVWSSSIWRAIHICNSDLPEGINPQWEDDEPIEVELKIEKI